jgi:phosphoglycolate phosphatase
VAELLDELTDRAVPLAIVTNKPEAATQVLAGKLLSRWPFASVTGQQEGVPRKPDPSRALAAAEALGVSPAACIFVGDSEVDMRTARNAGMVPVGVAWGFRPVTELWEAGARNVIDEPAKLLDYLA